MSEDTVKKFSESNPNKLDLILLTLQRLQEDLLVAKCEIKTSVREVGQKYVYLEDVLIRIKRETSEISERLHGIELKQDRQNSQT
jgi:hypothetical protein